MSDRARILVTVSGVDTPGITAALTKLIADASAKLADVEQVVVQGQLTLCLLLDVARSEGTPVVKDLLFTAKEMGLDLDFRVLDAKDEDPELRRRYVVTAIGDHVGARAVHVLAKTLADHQANIDGIRKLSDATMASVEINLSLVRDDAAEAALKKELGRLASEHGFDVAIQRDTLSRRSKRLIVMDMDSTLIQVEIIDELARQHGVYEKVAAVTKEAMEGGLEFEESLRRRVKALEGLDFSVAEGLAADLPVTEGAEQLLNVLRRLGLKTAVISGGFTFATDALKKRLQLDYAYANVLEVRDGKLTGNVVGPIVGPQRKADLLDVIAQQEGMHLDQTIAVGDGANDLRMLDKAGLGIAFHAKATLKEKADTTLSAGGLDRILYFLGLRAKDVRDFLEA